MKVAKILAILFIFIVLLRMGVGNTSTFSVRQVFDEMHTVGEITDMSKMMYDMQCASYIWSGFKNYISCEYGGTYTAYEVIDYGETPPTGSVIETYVYDVDGIRTSLVYSETRVKGAINSFSDALKNIDSHVDAWFDFNFNIARYMVRLVFDSVSWVLGAVFSFFRLLFGLILNRTPV